MIHVLWKPIVNGARPHIYDCGWTAADISIDEQQKSTIELPKFDTHTVDESTAKTVRLLRKAINEQLGNITMSLFQIDEVSLEAGIKRIEEDPFFHYLADNFGGANDGAWYISSAFAKIAGTLSGRDAGFPSPGKIADAMRASEQYIQHLTAFNFFPQKVLDATVDGTTGNPFVFVDGINPHVEISDDILTFIQKLGEEVITNPAFLGIRSDDDAVAATIINLLPHSWWRNFQGADVLQAVFTQMKGVVLLSLRDRFGDETEDSKRLIDSLIEGLSYLEQIQLMPPDYRAELIPNTILDDDLKNQLFFVFRLMKIYDQYQVNPLQKETFGCPVRYAGIFHKWYEYWSQTLVDWYTVEAAQT